VTDDDERLAADDTSSNSRRSGRRVTKAKDGLIIAALGAGMTHSDAGRAAGVSNRTVRRRLEDPTFSQRVADAAAEYVDQLSKQLTRLAPSAIETMSMLMSAPDSPPAVKLRAATCLLNASRVWRDATELEERLRQLETQVAETGQELS